MDNDSTLSKGAGFIWRNARLLERRLFAYLFEEGSKEGVLAALLAYRNEDGGFGNALEPDKRAPAGQPVDQEWALRVLDDIDAYDDAVIAGVCAFLQTITTPEGGIPSALPSANAYPATPWWVAEENPPAAINPTASITGYLLKHGVRHPWVEKATEYCWRTIAATATREFHDLIPIIIFLESAPDRARAEAELARISKRIAEPGVVDLDPQATGYVHGPLEWAPTPASVLRPLFTGEVIAAHLRALAARQQPDGGWPITWPAISLGVELEWRGWMTLQALRTLKAYGALGTG